MAELETFHGSLERDGDYDRLDLAGAIVTRFVIGGCRVGQLTLSRAKLKATDLRGAELSSITGLMELSGATISNEQLHDLAPSFATHPGISIA